jgi:hypothetical protein
MTISSEINKGTEITLNFPINWVFQLES